MVHPEFREHVGLLILYISGDAILISLSFQEDFFGHGEIGSCPPNIRFLRSSRLIFKALPYLRLFM
jgi:hypothetical protein